MVKGNVDHNCIVIVAIAPMLVVSIVIVAVIALRKSPDHAVVQNMSTNDIAFEANIGKGSFVYVWLEMWKGKHIAVKVIPLEKRTGRPSSGH